MTTKNTIKESIELLSNHAPLPCWRMGKYKKEYSPKIKTQKTFIGSLIIHNIFTIFLQTKEENISSFTIMTGNNHTLNFSSLLNYHQYTDYTFHK